MPCYRLFFRNARTGHFIDSETLSQCVDDRDALHRLADHMPREGEIELWDRDRLVAILKSVARAA